MNTTTRTITLADRYDRTRTATVRAHDRSGAYPWISSSQYRAALKRARVMDGSYFVALGRDQIDVYDNDALVHVIPAANA